jgi:Carboxypeptidase regulatory-like domain
MKPRTTRVRLSLAGLEDRTTPTATSITGNFNGTAIAAGDTVWFSSVGKVSGLGTNPSTLYLTDGTISFTANGSPTTVSVPNATISFTQLATTATTTYSAGSGWLVTAPPHFSGNVFLGGTGLPVPGGLPGGIKNVTWQWNVSSDTAGLKVNWQWAAAAYTNFGANGTFGVKSVDDNNIDTFRNSDHAGTPEDFKSFVVGGATGGGGSNFTGSYSATKTVLPDFIAPPTQTATLSGSVTVIDTGAPVSGVEIDLVDGNGNVVAYTATDRFGDYSFTNIAAGTYTVHEGAIDQSVYFYWGNSPGMVNGATDGQFFDAQDISSVMLIGGNVGVNYNFLLGTSGGNPT